MFTFQIYITNKLNFRLKFIYSEKATKFCEIFALLLTGTTQDKSKVKISQNSVAFSEYMNFTSFTSPHFLSCFHKNFVMKKKKCLMLCPVRSFQGDSVGNITVCKMMRRFFGLGGILLDDYESCVSV